MYVCLHGCRKGLVPPPMLNLSGWKIGDPEWLLGKQVGEIITTTCTCWYAASVLCLPGLVWVKAQNGQEVRGTLGAKTALLTWYFKVCLPNRHCSQLDLVETTTCDILSTSFFSHSLTLLSNHGDNREAANNTEIHWLVGEWWKTFWI